MRVPPFLLAAAVLAAVPVAGLAQDPDPRTTPAPADAGHVASDGVTHVLRIPGHVGTAGGRLLDDGTYVVTDPRGLYLYDTSDPLAPEVLGSIPIVQSSTFAVFGQEDVDTNGEIVLVEGVDPTNPAGASELKVVDITDRTAPTIIGTAPVGDHTWTCVADCTYAYGRDGNTVDLRDPTNPVIVDMDWRTMTGHDQHPESYTHDFTEVAPGRLFSAGEPSYYLDVSDPENPIKLTEVELGVTSLGFHGIEWANDGQDPLVMMGTELAPRGEFNLVGSDCQDDHSFIAAYDATEVLAEDATRQDGTPGELSATFERVGEWRVPGRGAAVDGNAPAHVLYCAHWFDLHPDWDAGGLLAAGYYDWGLRFLAVGPDGAMDEVAWFRGFEGYGGSARWITDDVVYVHDYRRGLEVIQLDRSIVPDQPAPAPDEEAAPDGGPAPAPDAGDDGTGMPATGGGLAALGLLLAGSALAVRRWRA